MHARLFLYMDILLHASYKDVGIHLKETPMKKFRLWLVAFASIMIIGQLILTDYDDLSWSNNAGNYLGIISMVCIIISMILSNRHENKQEN